MMINLDVIIPVYQTSYNDIKKCLDSILNQLNDSLQLYIQIYVIIDGDDNAINYINQYNHDGLLRHNVHLNIITNTSNKGVSYSRNKAIMMSSGEYILFIDSDDYLEEGSLQVLYDTINEYDTVSAIKLPIKIDVSNDIKMHDKYPILLEAVNSTCLGGLCINRSILRCIGYFSLDNVFKQYGGEEVPLLKILNQYFNYYIKIKNDSAGYVYQCMMSKAFNQLKESIYENKLNIPNEVRLKATLIEDDYNNSFLTIKQMMKR